MALSEAPKKAKKKKKKSKKTQPEEVVAAASVPAKVEGETKEQRKARKKAKKEAKRKAAEEAAAAEAKAARKAAKKAKKAKKKEAAAAATAAAATPEVKPSKKRKAMAISSGSRMSQAEAAAYRVENKVAVTGQGAELIVPWAKFSESGFPADVLSCTTSFAAPTPIQAQSWPILEQERDVIGVAKTGSGKTLGFLLPALCYMKDNRAKPRKPTLLVVSPTRELAMQTDKVCQDAGRGCGITSACIFGGVPKWPQVKALNDGCDIVVATPGRLLGLMEEGACDLSDVRYLILDEADRMLDDGFKGDILRISGACPDSKKGKGQPGRQTLLFSATWPDEVKKLGQTLTHNAVKVQIGDAGAELTTNKDVTQRVEVIEDHHKDRRLLQLLKQHHSTKKNRIIIFGLYKKDIGRLAGLCTRNGFPATGISSNLTQDQRNAALANFKNGSAPLLVATDVAGRGLDVRDVTHVINYSFPLTIEDYVHRIGRTGRGGKSGASITFFNKNDKLLAGALSNVLRDGGAEVPKELIAFGTFTKKKKHGMYGDFAGRTSNIPMKKRTRVTF